MKNTMIPAILVLLPQISILTGYYIVYFFQSL